MSWISVDDRLPTNEKYKVFHVRVEVGSVKKDTHESQVIGKVYKDSDFRFVTSDWETVTHWWEE